MSDYDDEDDVPLAQSRMRYTSQRVREGSEGVEVRPSRPWLYENALSEDDSLERPLRSQGRPWEQEGRYQLYEPADPEWDDA